MENMNNQGKTPKQIKDSESFISFSMMGILILLLVMLLSSCGVTKTTTTYKCELMEQGQKCLPDHSCCKE